MLNELAVALEVTVVVHEERVPVLPPVPARASCWVSTRCTWRMRERSSPQSRPLADEALALLRAVPGGEWPPRADVTEDPTGMVLVNTAFGGRRVMDMLVGDPLPRIC